MWVCRCGTVCMGVCLWVCVSLRVWCRSDVVGVCVASRSIESLVSLFLCECRVVGGCVQECDMCML